MKSRQRWVRAAAAVLTTTAMIGVGLVAANPAAAQTEAAASATASTAAASVSTDASSTFNPLPVFEYQGLISDKETMIYNPTDEYIFPSVFHAGEYFENPLAEWYLYFAPHNDPGGIILMYSDSLEGPWTEYTANPVITNEWPPYYEHVPHVSTPDAFWNAAEQKMFLYFHGDNGNTRFATSTDGVSFDYGDVAVNNEAGGAGTTETSYARVFEHPDPSSGFNYAMFYMDNTQPNIRRIRIAESTDARTWQVRAEPIVVPGTIEGQNVSSANLWEWDGQLYVVYHASSGKIHARAINAALTETGPTLDLFEASGVGDDTGRVAAPDIVSDGENTYLFYESGDRLGGTIKYAKLNPDAVREQVPAPNPDPVYEQCPGAGSDEFDGAELNRGLWPTIVREDASRHGIVDGALLVPTYPAGVAGEPLIQRTLPDGAWEATTKVDVSPTAKYHQAGLLMYTDDRNYAKFDLTYGQDGLRFEYILRQNGSDRNTASDGVAPGPDLGQSMWLRLTSDGQAVTAAASVDGDTFTPVGRTVDLGSLAPTAIGPFAMQGSATPAEISAAFDWFRWSPTEAELEACAALEPPADEETSVPGVGTLSSTSGWATGLHDGNFTVNLDLWWGSNASSFALYENGVEVSRQALQPNTPNAQHAAFEVTGKANGVYVYTSELVNSQGVTATKTVTVNVTDAAPAVPVLSHNNRDKDGAFSVTANLWWGTNATSYRLLENGVEVAAGELTAASPAAQRVVTDLVDRTTGDYEYVIELSNAAGSTSSKPITVRVR